MESLDLLARKYMRWCLNKTSRKEERGVERVWKEDFSDCATSAFLPEYSVCLCEDHEACRHVATYGGMTLCGNPLHKSFIIEDPEPDDRSGE